jgi:hypothetical protein
MISIMVMASMVVGTNLCEYNFIFKNKASVHSCTAVEAILPNGDRVQIPAFNGKVPVMYIHSIGVGKSDLVLDFDDSLCKPIGSSKTFSYQVGDNNKDSLLDTFSSIQKQIESLKSINRKDGDEQSRLLMSLSKDIKDLNKLSNVIEELKTMIANTQTIIGSKQNEQDIGKSFSDLKSMISEVRRELVDIQKKLEKQTSKPHDIIDPNLPILDKVGVSGDK